MTISPIAFPAAPVAPIAAPNPASAAGAATAATSAASAVGGHDFASALTHGIDALQAAQSKADSLAVQAATGGLTDVHDYMIAATEASLATDLTVAVRNKAVEAFTEIMRMPV